MEKSEILLRLQELYRILEMNSFEYADEWNRNHPDERLKLAPADVWAVRTGIVRAEINDILKN